MEAEKQGMDHLRGKIVKALSGFYYVAAEERLYACRARGLFRKDGRTPLVGDDVVFAPEGDKGTVTEILPRKNEFLRPAVANIDCLVIFASCAIPVTDPFLIDRVTALAQSKDIQSILCVNKTDLEPADRLSEIYLKAGYPVACTSAVTGEGIKELWNLIRGKTVAFTGNSGVGKSAVLHELCPSIELETGEVSQKLGRGRHTTRHVELYSMGENTFAVDTPGFSSFDVERMEYVPKEELQEVFPEFRPFLGQCRFQDCTHRKEPDCAVLAAVAAGMIPVSRHQSYLRLYESASQIKPWEQK